MTPHGPKETQGRSGLPYTTEPHRRPCIPWIMWILLILYSTILGNCSSTTQPYKEIGKMALGQATTQSF